MRRTLITAICLAALAQTAAAQIVALMPSASGEDKSSANELSSSSTVRISAQKGLNWLLDYKGSVNWFTLFAMRDINENYCHRTEIDSYIATRIPKLPDNQMNSGLRRLMDGDTGFAHRDGAWLQLSAKRFAPEASGLRRPSVTRHTSEALALMALYCDIHPLPEQAEKQIFDIRSVTGETLTNLFSAMALLEKMGCKSREKDKDFRTIFRTTAEKVSSEQEPLNAGLLEFAGYPELVKEEWIRNIIGWQFASGAWSGREYKPENPDPYSTSIAVWTLTRYLNECPLADNTDFH